MAVDATSPSQVLDLLFDEDNGVLSKELDLDGKTKVETLSFVSICWISFTKTRGVRVGVTSESSHVMK